jgi:hypothetical protein
MTNWHDPARELATMSLFATISGESSDLSLVTVAVVKFKHVMAGLYM